MRRLIVVLAFALILIVSFTPIRRGELGFHILLSPLELEEGQEVTLLENNPTEYRDKNTSFERIYLMDDMFSDRDGYRPYPWGQEIFGGDPDFLSDNTVARSGNRSFKLIGDSVDDVGALAVPGYYDKPKVEPGEVYYLSFWIKYDFEKGEGIRVFQQFFIHGDYWYPRYAVYGDFITGSSDGEWVQVGLLARAPRGAVRGDPVILMSGKGVLWVDDAYFGKAKIE